MNKQEFSLLVDGLLSKADAIPFDNYGGATSVIRDFENFVLEHKDYVNQFALEHIGEAEIEFEKMKKASKRSKKQEHWSEGCYKLRREIEAMKFENKYSE